jgi:hypothetical protein
MADACRKSSGWLAALAAANVDALHAAASAQGCPRALLHSRMHTAGWGLRSAPLLRTAHLYPHLPLESSIAAVFKVMFDLLPAAVDATIWPEASALLCSVSKQL